MTDFSNLEFNQANLNNYLKIDHIFPGYRKDSNEYTSKNDDSDDKKSTGPHTNIDNFPNIGGQDSINVNEQLDQLNADSVNNNESSHKIEKNSNTQLKRTNQKEKKKLKN